MGPSYTGTGVFDTALPGIPDVLYRTVSGWEPATSDESDEPEFSGIYTPGQEPTDWDQVYREYEILNPPEEEMAHDWGHLIRQGIETVTGIGQPQVFDPPNIIGTLPAPAGGGGGVVIGGGGGGLCPPSGSCGGPRYLTYDCKTGQMSVRRRRRRRRLLTDGDKQDLGTIVAMFGKGAAAQIALAAAVKR